MMGRVAGRRNQGRLTAPDPNGWRGPRNDSIMFRKLLAFGFLILLAVGVWAAARWLRHRNDLRATVVFERPTSLREGNHITRDGLVIGQVTGVVQLEQQEAISIRIDSAYRKQLQTDSSYELLGAPPNVRVEVKSMLAIGKPLADGAVVYAREDKLKNWLEKQKASVAPFLERLSRSADDLKRKYEAGEFDRELEKWKKKVPEWEKEGGAALSKHVEEIRKKVAGVEAELRQQNRGADADSLRRRFEGWLEEVTAKDKDKSPAQEPRKR